MKARRATVFQHHARPVLDVAVDGLMVAENVGHLELVVTESRLERFEDGSGLVFLPSRGIDIEVEEMVYRFKPDHEGAALAAKVFERADRWYEAAGRLADWVGIEGEEHRMRALQRFMSLSEEQRDRLAEFFADNAAEVTHAAHLGGAEAAVGS